MKIALSGKGGVGKTTLAAMLAAEMTRDGQRVIAIDADPDANLAAALGLPPERHPTPLSQMKDLVKERTGRSDPGGYFRLNPKVDDIPDTYATRIGLIHLLALGGVSEGGAGCICPATALVKALLTHLILGRDEQLILDMEAGIEHLGRATAQSMDALIIVVNDDVWSTQTAGRIRKLAGDLHMKRLYAVLNRATDATDPAAVQARLDGIELIGAIPFDPRLAGGIAAAAGPDELHLNEGFTAHAAAAEAILQALRTRLENQP